MLDPTPLLDLLAPMPAGQIADLLGVDRRTIVRWRNGHSGVDPTKADRYAVAAGRLAYEIWPHLLEQAVDQVTRVCELEQCGNEFVPNVNHQRFCSTACLEISPHRLAMKAKVNRERQREQYQTDPEYRAAQIAKAKAYRAKYGDRINARKRRARAERRAA